MSLDQHPTRGTNPWIEHVERAWRVLGDLARILLRSAQLPPDQQRDDAWLAWFLTHLGTLAPQVPIAMERRRPALHSARETAPFYVLLHGPDDRHLDAGSYSDLDGF